MKSHTNKIANLIIKYRKTTLNDKEQEELNAWRSLSEENEILFQSLIDDSYLSELKIDLRADWKKIKQLYKAETGRSFPMSRPKFLSIAASIIILLTAGIIWFSLPSSVNKPVLSIIEPQGLSDSTLAVKDVLQTVKEVTLILANDSTIQLDKMDIGSHIDYGNSHVVKVNNEKLQIIPGNGPESELNQVIESPRNKLHEVLNTIYNTLKIPRGRTYELELADGSTVWLNAASTFRFPMTFGSNERKVELTGEAYFKVNQVLLAGTNKIPFTVSVYNMKINVHATQFNVSAYGDEPITTTLIAGEIDIMHAGLITSVQPGQQATFSNGQLISLNNANIEADTAWKSKQFFFRDTPLRNIMLQLTRWYDVEFTFNCCESTPYTTTASRKEPLPALLDDIEETGEVHFKIIGRKILVTSK